MKLVYVGDFRGLPNWGCRSTGAALGALLSEEHEIVDRIALELLQDTGAWDRYATPGIRYGSMVPRRVFNRAWKRRTAHPRAYAFYRKVEAAFGAKFDFIAADPNQSVRDFHKARRENKRLQEIYELIDASDAIVVNGEGTMIFSNPARRDVLFTLFLVALAYERGKKVYFLNAMFSECPSTGLDEKTATTAALLLEKAAAVVVRDRSSYDFLTRRSDKLPITILPDALFTWRDRVRSVAPPPAGRSGTILPFGFESLDEKISFDEPYICISGSSSAYRKGEKAAIEAYANLYIVVVSRCESIGTGRRSLQARGCSDLRTGVRDRSRRIPAPLKDTAPEAVERARLRDASERVQPGFGALPPGHRGARKSPRLGRRPVAGAEVRMDARSLPPQHLSRSGGGADH